MKVIIRLLSADNMLLAWGETSGEMRGDGALWPAKPQLELIVEQTGTVAWQNAHWTDLNVNFSQAIGPMPVMEGQRLVVEFNRPLVRVASSLESLPAVTLRDHAVISILSAGTEPSARVH